MHTYVLSGEIVLMKQSVWILGDQLVFSHPGFAASPEAVFMMEALGRAGKRPWHRQKLAFVWSAMRHFAEALRIRGYHVDYHEQALSTRQALQDHLKRHQPDRLILMETAEYRRARRLAKLARELGVAVDVVPNSMFLSDKTQFEDWIGDRKSMRLESFYRDMRRRLGLLMDNGQPTGGQWNYDKQNRQRPAGDMAFPSLPRFEPDGVTKAILSIVAVRADLFGDLQPFMWPVTHMQAKQVFKDFLDHRLDCFGPYEDAIVERSRALCHSLISPLLNVGLLDPLEVCRAVEARYEDGKARLNSAEGFIRQVIGWREFVYQVYHHFMPDYITSNFFDADLPLPAFYWTGETSMRCVAEAIRAVQAHGINHHIQRLMITGNLALLLGVDPQAVNRWYLSVYVDAYEWVVTPNVLGLALFADGGIIATKPYAASANYINKMSDHCGRCDYNHRKTVGTDACPFNALYWDFLARNKSLLQENPRMGLMLSLLTRKDPAELQVIRSRAKEILSKARSGAHL